MLICFAEGVLLNVCVPGPEISPATFKALMRDCSDWRSKFEYSDEGLFPLGGVLFTADINSPNSKKRSKATLSTVSPNAD